MSAFNWTEKMSVGHPLMDAQHRQIIELLNSFDDSFDPAIAFDAIVSMFRYARTHFHDEEMLLERAGYPGLERQKREHQEFLSKADELAKQDTRDYTLHISLATFLVKWLKNHIEVEDMQYKPYVAKLTDTPSA